MSSTTDDGYMVSPNRRSLALTTVPGQPVRPRYAALEQLFGEETRLHGVIYVASNGYDHVWPGNAELFANNLKSYSSYDMDSLRNRNLRYERENFQDICSQILRKRFIAPEESRPKWLLVLVNKADLYWHDQASVENYYLPGCGSDFDNHAQDLVSRIGSTALQYYILPLSTENSAYEFRSSFGTITTPSTLTTDQKDASIRCVVDSLGDLCDA